MRLHQLRIKVDRALQLLDRTPLVTSLLDAFRERIMDHCVARCRRRCRDGMGDHCRDISLAATTRGQDQMRSGGLVCIGRRGKRRVACHAGTVHVSGDQQLPRTIDTRAADHACVSART